MIVVDTSVWINKLRDIETAASRKLDSIANTREIIVGDVILLEVLQGARSDESAARMERLLKRFTVKPMLSEHLAIKAAGSYRHLRQRGITIRSSIDLVIATFCIEWGHALLQDDRDFLPMTEHLGLQLA